MKTILLLGGSRQQVPVIEKARELGLRTVLMDYLPDNPGKDYADKWYPESTTDVEKVLEIAKAEDAIGILAYASDPAALPAAIVCEKLGLPTNPAKSVEILGVKHKFRKYLKDSGFPCPGNVTFSKSDNISEIKARIKSALSFPIVIKPTDSSGSKGVSFLQNEGEIEKALEGAEKYSRNGILIAEEFIERKVPEVIGGDIFVEDGEITLFGEMGCLRGDGGKSLIPIGKKKNINLTLQQKANLHDSLSKLVKALGLKFGELNIEVLIDKFDRPHFLEVGPRAGGNMIPIQLSDAFGVDLPMANVKVAIGEKADLKPKEPANSFMTYVVHSLEDGFFEYVDFHPDITPYIYRKVIYLSSGDKVEKFDGAGKAVGIIFMNFPDDDTMNSFGERITDLIKVRLRK